MKAADRVRTMTGRSKVILGGAITGLVLVAFTSSPVLASAGGPSMGAGTGEAPMHEQMNRMMDSVHGEGTSQRMHEAMGPRSEKMMDQCVSGMGDMQGMMGGGGASGSGRSGSGMMGN